MFHNLPIDAGLLQILENEPSAIYNFSIRCSNISISVGFWKIRIMNLKI